MTRTLEEARDFLWNQGQYALSDLVDQAREWLEWQPIETAPKDGTRIVVWDHDGQAEIAYWNLDGWDSEGLRLSPTHWRPIGPGPKGEK